MPRLGPRNPIGDLATGNDAFATRAGYSASGKLPKGDKSTFPSEPVPGDYRFHSKERATAPDRETLLPVIGDEDVPSAVEPIISGFQSNPNGPFSFRYSSWLSCRSGPL